MSFNQIEKAVIQNVNHSVEDFLDDHVHTSIKDSVENSVIVLIFDLIDLARAESSYVLMCKPNVIDNSVLNFLSEYEF